jgi:FkbM family methyltransferase
MTMVAELLAPARLTEIVDIGANPIDGNPPYEAMLTLGLCRVTGFEPQPEALARLNELKGPNERYLGLAVGDGSEAVLKVCAASGMSSLLEPLSSGLDFFNLFPEFGRVVSRVPLDTRTLDSIVEIAAMDFLKIDIQGGELAVFQHGRRLLSQAVAVQTEVSFVPLYVDQPTIGEIDSELRAQGFMPHCMPALKKWPISPWMVNGDPRRGLNQLLEADIVYIRGLLDLDGLDTEQLKHIALIAQYCYRSFDLVVRCLKVLEDRADLPQGSSAKYLAAMVI